MGTKLLGAGVPITSGLIDQLSARGVTRVVVSKRDLAAMQAGTPQGTRSKALDHQYRQSENLTDRAKPRRSNQPVRFWTGYRTVA